jgi:alpha-amylase/alpha-mannosidase (GH57 family)
VGDCGIVNCSSRKECDSLAEYLRKYGFNGTSYHTGFTETKRESMQRNLMAGLCQVWVFNCIVFNSKKSKLFFLKLGLSNFTGFRFIDYLRHERL